MVEQAQKGREGGGRERAKRTWSNFMRFRPNELAMDEQVMRRKPRMKFTCQWEDERRKGESESARAEREGRKESELGNGLR